MSCGRFRRVRAYDRLKEAEELKNRVDKISAGLDEFLQNQMPWIIVEVQKLDRTRKSELMSQLGPILKDLQDLRENPPINPRIHVDRMEAITHSAHAVVVAIYQ